MWRQTKKEFDAEVISGGRVTIPKSVRRILKLHEGNIVSVTIEIKNDSEENETGVLE